MRFHVQLVDLVAPTSFISGLVVYLQEQPKDYTQLVVIITGLITVLATLLTVLNTTRNDAYKNLRELYEQMKKDYDKDIEEIKKDMASEKKRSTRYENYIRVLTSLLSASSIQFPSLDAFDAGTSPLKGGENLDNTDKTAAI